MTTEGITTIKTNYGKYIVRHTQTGVGIIECDFRSCRVEGTCVDAALDALESMILAHACADINLVRNSCYVDGINTALDAIFNEN